jgi:cyclic pyranopterin phosphate synthase
MVVTALQDAAQAGFSTIRLYGGEPLLHPGLPKMVSTCRSLGMSPYVSTNGILLTRKLPALVEAGLQIMSFGYYGSGDLYDSYVGVKGSWKRFEAAVAGAREKFAGKLDLHMSFVLNTRTCSLRELEYAWQFASKHELKFHVDLVHYSLPYFTEGPDRELQFQERDAPRIYEVAGILQELGRERPDLYAESATSIRSIPDWLLKGPDMRVPCDSYDTVWIGADGSVRLCWVTFPFGNLYNQSLASMMFTDTHRKACSDAVQLNCPNCHCSRDTRIRKHLPSVVRYSSLGQSLGFRPTAIGSAPPEPRISTAAGALVNIRTQPEQP